MVLDLLKCYVFEHKAKWEQFLPWVKYAYNNTIYCFTEKASFEIVEGGKKISPILHTKEKIFEADHFVEDLITAYEKVKYALQCSQAKQKEVADQRRHGLVFKEGD